jgi:2-polyprenyl-6-methoxyphenol hydroxylase-like FAD-dependent oxidoreductase
MYTSVPAAPGTPANVTVLGDAIHAMTPTLGRGANVAMRDGALLGRELKKVAGGQLALPEALAAYERDLTAYGFSVVGEAAVIGEQRMAPRTPCRNRRAEAAHTLHELASCAVPELA